MTSEAEAPSQAESRSEPASTSAGASKESCVKYFDALWFCYSPVYQIQQYYRYGNADDCMGHWSDLYACLKKRTKFAHQVQEDPMKGKHPLWKLRSKEEAAEFWQKEFGHLSPQKPEDLSKQREGSQDLPREKTII